MFQSLFRGNSFREHFSISYKIYNVDKILKFNNNSNNKIQYFFHEKRKKNEWD